MDKITSTIKLSLLLGLALANLMVPMMKKTMTVLPVGDGALVLNEEDVILHISSYNLVTITQENGEEVYGDLRAYREPLMSLPLYPSYYQTARVMTGTQLTLRNATPTLLIEPMLLSDSVKVAVRVENDTIQKVYLGIEVLKAGGREVELTGNTTTILNGETCDLQIHGKRPSIKADDESDLITLLYELEYGEVNLTISQGCN